MATVYSVREARDQHASIGSSNVTYGLSSRWFVVADDYVGTIDSVCETANAATAQRVADLLNTHGM